MHRVRSRLVLSRYVRPLIAALVMIVATGVLTGAPASAQPPPGQIQPPCILIFPPPPGCQQQVPGRISANASGPYGGRVGQQIVMRASVQSPLPPGTSFSFQWSFGDGTSGFGQTTSKVYTTPGTYVVSVTVIGGGQSAAATTSASITQPVQPLQVSAGGPYAGRSNLPVQFQSTVTNAPLGTQITYQWGFGDGTFGGGPSPAHVYAQPGVYQVTLSVSTSAGQNGFASTTVQITQPIAPLVASAGGPYAGVAGSSVSFFGSVSGAQRPGFQWSFGDGGGGSGQSTAHVYANAGTYFVTLTVTDLATGQSTQSLTTASIAPIPAPPPGPPPPPPPPHTPFARTLATMVYYPPTRQVILFGGLVCQGNQCADQHDTWAWDGSTWTQLSPANAPSSRYSAGMAYHAGTRRLILFGGLDCTGSSCTDLGDTWAWDGGNWTRLTPAASPGERSDMQMAYDAERNVVVLFGGQDTGGDLLGDTWTFDGANWTQHSPAASPPARYGFGMDFDVARGVTVMFGGSDNGSANLGDTWMWDGTTWTEANPSISPTPRSFTAMVYDAARNVTVLFGGATNGNQPLGDTWIWNGSTWAQQMPRDNPPARYGTSLMFDALTGVAVMFSGTNGDPDTWQWDGNTWTRG